jgi:hypothetical protein
MGWLMGIEPTTTGITTLKIDFYKLLSNSLSFSKKKKHL